MSEASRQLDTVLGFVNGLGIRAEIGAVAAGSFLGGVRIEGGSLVVDPPGLLTPGDVLHEAGHLAVLPARYRPRLNDDVDTCVAAILAEQPDDTPMPPALQALRGHGGELQAIAWSYVACLHLELPLGMVFCPGAYGASPDQSPMQIAQQIEFGFFPGINWLVMSGMTTLPRGLLNPDAPPGGFPRMRLWTQP